jgi:2-dehydropantoate 2-reductase
MLEISSVALALPELQGVHGVKERFSPSALEKTVMSIIDRTRETTCSMVWDLRARRETEIRYINGYWIRRGRELGIPTPLNERLLCRIQSQTAQAIEGN